MPVTAMQGDFAAGDTGVGFGPNWGAYTRHLAPDEHCPGKRNTQKIERKHLTLRTRINPTASFNSLSNVLVRKGVVTSRSWLTEDTLRWSWDPTSSVSSGAGTFGGETEV